MIKLINPNLLINLKIIRNNIYNMTEKAKNNALVFRPHFKTHQSSAIAELFRDYGIRKATVSSLAMAYYFYKHGWTDLTIALPHNPLESHLMDDFPSQTMIGLLVDHPDTIKNLNQNIKKKRGIWIKIDTGANRCGIPWNDEVHLFQLAKQIKSCPKLHLLGLLSHAGQSYHAKTRETVLSVHQEQIERMAFSKAFLDSVGLSDLIISIGDTPCCSLAEDFKGIDEIRPGNFVFFDVDQLQRQVCQWQQVAMILRCPIIGRYPDRQQLVVHGGAVHLSKDHTLLQDGSKSFGLPVLLEKDSWTNPIMANLSSISQEHGVVSFFNTIDPDLKIGGFIGIMPIHSCLTADLFSTYITTEGKCFPKRRSTDIAFFP